MTIYFCFRPSMLQLSFDANSAQKNNKKQPNKLIEPSRINNRPIFLQAAVTADVAGNHTDSKSGTTSSSSRSSSSSSSSSIRSNKIINTNQEEQTINESDRSFELLNKIGLPI